MFSDDEEILLTQLVNMTAEATGCELKNTTIALIIDDLSCYSFKQVEKALYRCRSEVHGRLCLADIVERIDDGLPSADEAWGLISDSWTNDYITVIAPQIAFEAGRSGALALLENGDKTGARMAFREAYNKLRHNYFGQKIIYSISLSVNKDEAQQAIMNAVEDGRLSLRQALNSMPELAFNESFKPLLENASEAELKELGVKFDDCIAQEECKKQLNLIMSSIYSAKM